MTHRPTRRRRLAAQVAAVALAGSSVALLAAPAHAAEPDDPSFTPVSTDLIGVGSDTTQIALHKAAEAYDATATGFKVASFAATGGGQITLPNGAINRPNGSGAGKALLYGSGNNPEVDFARSSSALNTTEVGAGLQAFPFAVDTLVMAVSNNVPSNAPATLTPAQVVSIYKGDVTNWSQVGGKDGVIKPYIPQAGSGTRSFFQNQLKAANGGVDVVLAKSVAESQEHDDTLIKGDPNAVAPFSLGRARLLGSTLRFEGTDTTKDATGQPANFIYPRAVYNVVRGGTQGNADIQAFFGPNGFLCSNAARDLIAAGGLDQMASSAAGGACGQVTQTAVTNYATNKSVPSTTSLALSSTKAGQVTLTATVSASTSPSGSVTFLENGQPVASGIPLTSGQAVTTLTGVTPGAHTYTAQFTSDSPATVQDSSDDATGTVVAASALKTAFPKAVAAGTKAKGTVTVTSAAGTPTGLVTVKVGSKKISSGTLSGGKVTLSLGKITKKTVFTVVYAGDSATAGATKKVTVKVS